MNYNVNELDESSDKQFKRILPNEFKENTHKQLNVIRGSMEDIREKFKKEIKILEKYKIETLEINPSKKHSRKPQKEIKDKTE